ncbi:hypothetical protein T12_16129 [Trichinella patagoniensis]|uniref:Uncharacterized protein n=1 Tax=Trichinella patagoniensis TaxID=990121 RepID=A0A0V0YQK9_9BILA|nr:hypothetical protein T12_16129 [Trichinella patagoniensis]
MFLLCIFNPTTPSLLAVFQHTPKVCIGFQSHHVVAGN